MVATRKIEAIKSVISPFERYELLPFEYEQAIKFVNRVVKDKELINIIDEGLKRNDLMLSYTPMTLHLLIEIATNEKEIPASMTEIYERYTDDVCGKNDRIKGIESIFAYYIKKRFLSELAWEEFYNKGRLEITKADFDRFVEGYLKKRRYEKAELEHFLEEVRRAGLIIMGEKVIFRHRSFLDYFSAFRLINYQRRHRNIIDDLVRIYFNTMWNDVAFFFIGILREIPEELIDEIDNYQITDAETLYLKVMIGRLLQAGWYSDSNIKSKGLSIGLKNLQPLRSVFVNMIESDRRKVPIVLADFFALFICEYSFGTRTIRNEALDFCSMLCTDDKSESVQNCVHLLWANRGVFSPEDIESVTERILDKLSELERVGLLTIRDKFVDLFVLEQSQEKDSKLLKVVKRKLKQFRRVYKDELKNLLPEPRKGFRK